MYIPGAMMANGTLFITNNLELVYKTIADPQNQNRCMILDMDEQDNTLEANFPTAAAKATILLPPTTAVFKEIDGDQNGFVQEYFVWLGSDTVEDFMSAVILMMCRGFNVLLYAPSYSEDSIWVNELLKNIEMKYGIHVGTSSENGYAYNFTYDAYNVDLMYIYGAINVVDYMTLLPPLYITPPLRVQARLTQDLYQFSGGFEPPEQTFARMRAMYEKNPNTRPVIMFE